MRTIIINAIGERMQHSRLFFLPFREEELVWFDCEITQPEQCVAEISKLLAGQNVRQDYCMVILTDLSAFRKTEHEHIRKGCQQLMRAYWNERLLRPMVEQHLDLPCGVTELFLYSGTRESHGGVAEDKVLRMLFSLERWSQTRGPLTMEFVRHGEERELDVSALFQLYLEEYRQWYEKDRQDSPPDQSEDEDENVTLLLGKDGGRESARQQREEAEKRRLDDLETGLKERLADLQEFRFELGGDQGEARLVIEEQLFPINDEDPELVYADLQLNLSRYLEAFGRWNGAGEPPHIEVTPHTAQSFGKILNRAEHRLNLAQRNKSSQVYYKLETGQTGPDISEVEEQIRNGLQKHTRDLYGVADALGDAPEPGDSLGRGWFLIGREIRRFRGLVEQLKKQYDEEAVRANQSAILDLCANAFHAWRGTHGGVPEASTPKATETQRPQMELKELRDSLDQQQKAYFQANVSQLERYEDVRQEAAEIQNRFENLARFWSPKTRGHDLSRFRRFSLVMAAIFLVVMILPYALIEWGQVDVGFPKYLWFLACLGGFAAAYGAGVVCWMHQLWKKLRECTLALYHLMQTSSERRRESIRTAIRIYGEILPECFRDSQRLREMEALDRKNAEKEENYKWHDRLLEDAIQELRELRSALRLEKAGDYLEPDKQIKPLDYDLPPWEGKNREAYLIFWD